MYCCILISECFPRFSKKRRAFRASLVERVYKFFDCWIIAMIFILWLLTWLFSIIHPFLNGIYLITFVEYQNNHISSISLCKNVNIMTKVEYISHAVLVLILLIFVKHTWVGVLVNLPIFLYHLRKFWWKKPNSYELDPTSFYKEIGPRKKEAIFKIVYYVFLFGFYLFSFIRAVILFEKSLR